MNEENIKQIIEMQDKNYAVRIGTTFGIYRIDDVQYNWASRTQEWTITCTKCGHSEIVPRSVGWDWLRGKGRSRNKCRCCIAARKEREKIEKNQKDLQRKHNEDEWLNSFIERQVNGWRLIERHNRTYVAICDQCGAKRNLPLSRIQSMDFNECKHPVDFSNPEFIGKRFGHLTVQKYIGGRFVVKCDCGFEKTVKCSSVNNGKTTTCGRKECEYHVRNMNYLGKYGELVREVGEETENDAYRMLLSHFCDVKKTPTSGDYGVDLICTDEFDNKTAIQVKNNKASHARTGVHAVMEVFAGGHFYDCDMYGIISCTGYTENAIKMAIKLGVALYDEKYEPIDVTMGKHPNVKYTWVVDGKEEPMVKTFRDNGWNGKDIKRYYGMTYEEVRNHFLATDMRKENIDAIKKLGLSLQMVTYRMNVMGMTFEEAISTPKLTPGRPRKQIYE